MRNINMLTSLTAPHAQCYTMHGQAHTHTNMRALNSMHALAHLHSITYKQP